MIEQLHKLKPEDRAALGRRFLLDLEAMLRTVRGINVRLPQWIKPPTRGHHFEYQLGHEGVTATRQRVLGLQVPDGHYASVLAIQIFIEYWSNTVDARAMVVEPLRNRSSVQLVNPPGTTVSAGEIGQGVKMLLGDVSFRSINNSINFYVLLGYGCPFYRVQNDRGFPMADVATQEYYGNGEPWFLGHLLLDEGERFEVFIGDDVNNNPRVVTLGLRGWLVPYRTRVPGPGRMVQE